MSLITLNNNDDKFLEEIFNDVISVYEDIQGSKLIVNYNGEDFEFRTKSYKNDPINLIDISLQKYYNKAINFFYSLDKRVLSLMPRNWHFVFEYFPDNFPAHIEYKKKPKNNLILTGIIKGKKFNYSIEEILEFSNLFDVDPLPVIFYGKLNKKQKEGIKYFLHTSEEDLEYIFGDKNFSFFFYKLLDPTYTNSFLMGENEFQPNTQRLIIRTSTNDYRYEILNPLYKKNSDTINTDFTDIYSLILVNFLSYLQNIDLNDIKISGKTYEESYINLISRLFNMYMNDTSEDLEEFDFEVPKFFNKEKFKINIDFIQNSLTKSYITDNEKFEYIFKCILGSFRQKKKKIIGVFTKNSLLLFNNFIDEIDSIINLHLNKVKEDSLKNSKMMNFGDYYDFKYDTDGAGEVYPDVYTEFEAPSDEIKDKKKKKKF
jgi:hypothetical protein